MRNFAKRGLLVGLLVTSASATAQPVAGSQPNQASASQGQMGQGQMGQGQMMGHGQMMNHAEMQRHMDAVHQSCGGMMSQMSEMRMGRRYN